MKPKDKINELCDQAGCDDKLRKLHAHEYLYRQWNPHPSQKFSNWWYSRGWQDTEKATDRAWSYGGKPLDHVRCYNCEAVREVYRVFLNKQLEAKQYGITATAT